MPSLQGDVKVPLLGNVPKKGVMIGVLGGAGILAYVYYKKKTAAAAMTSAAATGYGYGASAYGYGEGTPGYYGYGSDFQSYPGAGAEAYGYGAYGYGMYNPVTGQYYGPGPGPITSPPSSPPSWWTNPPPWWPKPNKKPPHHKPHHHKPGTSVITSQGNMDLYRIARLEGISEAELLKLNPHLKRYQGTGKHIPRGIKVRV